VFSDSGEPGEGQRVETRLAVLGRGAPRAREPLNVPIVAASNFRAASDSTAVRE
jgi:cystathionine gamma-synthase